MYMSEGLAKVVTKGQEEKQLLTYEERIEKRDEVVKVLMELHKFVTIMSSEEMYVYDHGIYIGNGKPEAIIKEFVEQYFGKACTKNDVAEVIARIQRKTIVEDNFFDDTPACLIPVINGILNLVNPYDMKEWSSDFHFLNLLNRVYSTEQYPDCPAIDKFLHEILDSEEDVQAIYEFIGYCLYRDYPIHKSFMFVGEGSNGKSTLLELIKRFLGSQNVSNISLQDLSNRFAIAELRGKLANFYSDLKDEAITNTGNFKMLTGNDSFSAEKKFVQRRMSFKNYAKFAFSCNKIPENRHDDTLAFWRRWEIFQFTKVFDDEHGNCDRNILEKLTTQEELNGLLVKAVEGLKRLLTNGKFSNEKGSEFNRKLWIRSDSVKAFLEECVETDLQAYEPKNKVYDTYHEFCLNNGISPLDSLRFGHKLKDSIGYQECQHKINGSRVWCYTGFKLKSKPEKTQTQLGDASGKTEN